MPTVKLVDENTTDPLVRRIFDEIRAKRKVDRIPNIWRALAAHPEQMEHYWTLLNSIMKPGKLDMLTKEMIAVAVSMTNSCRYCTNSHLAAAQKHGMDQEMLGELLSVVGLYNMFNKLSDSLQVEPDVLPSLD